MSQSQNWTEGFCNETTGFLFRHECQRPASWRCARCGKPVCDEHAQPVPAGSLPLPSDAAIPAPVGASGGGNPAENVTVCSACARPAQTQTQARSGRGTYWYDDDYYYRSRMYYPDYGNHAWASQSHHGHSGTGSPAPDPVHDPNDLTPADAESLATEGDEDYETDMGAS